MMLAYPPPDCVRRGAQHLKKKLENRRLDYDAKRTNLQKSKKEDKSELENEVNNAKNKYEETISTLRDLMLKVSANEVRGGHPSTGESVVAAANTTVPPATIRARHARRRRPRLRCWSSSSRPTESCLSWAPRCLPSWRPHSPIRTPPGATPPPKRFLGTHTTL